MGITKLCAGDLSWLWQDVRNWGCGKAGAGVCWRTVEDWWWLFPAACVEICWRWVHKQRGVGSVGRLLTAKSRSARGTSNLLSYMGGCLTICQTYLPCPPSGWVSHCFPCPLIGLIVVLLTFFWGCGMFLVLWELVLFYRMDVEFKGKIFSNYSRRVNWQQGVTSGVRLSVYNILDWQLYIVTLVQWCGGCTVVGDSCPEWECRVRLFSCDTVNILLKTNEGRGRGRKPNFIGGETKTESLIL